MEEILLHIIRVCRQSSDIIRLQTVMNSCSKKYEGTCQIAMHHAEISKFKSSTAHNKSRYRLVIKLLGWFNIYIVQTWLMQWHLVSGDIEAVGNSELEGIREQLLVSRRRLSA